VGNSQDAIEAIELLLLALLERHLMLCSIASFIQLTVRWSFLFFHEVLIIEELAVSWIKHCCFVEPWAMVQIIIRRWIITIVFSALYSTVRYCGWYLKVVVITWKYLYLGLHCGKSKLV
jgi:hypothetical protein